MVIESLSSQATSRVVELQRGSGDEKRRQDSAASFLPRPFVAGGTDFVANDAAKPSDDLSAVGGRAGKSGRAPSADKAQGSNPSSPEGGFPSFLREAADLVQNDRRSLFAAVGFSAQQLSEESGQEDEASLEARQSKSLEASLAYGSVQKRGDGRPPPASEPQLVTESGVLMGFGAFDELSRLDVTV
ncbi:hypothetical protein MTBLM1_40283 [Rhodospirillaceae bacterium LM-1]|nr:hypothetical protein MTBLM1_40283 [Rhodospirillaceae bacterium LM-1]